jgi:NTE family protein
VESGLLQSPHLSERGLPSVLSQTLRTIIHSRLEVGMAAYRDKYGGSDVVLLEPERDDYLMFFTNIFSFAERRAVCEHAYQSTRRHLLAHHDELAPVLARHGVTLRRDVLEEQRDLWREVGLAQGVRPRPSSRRAARAAGAADASGASDASGAALVRRLEDALGRIELLVDSS